ncbi:hypothetical protein QZH41_002818 [Actinostola sp. cb2023]|nr:hypothetical protein QZH41_002818 [Actinostola sp. cb2023]
MGSYDGAETCELIGLYILSLITPKLQDKIGLYRDDGLIVCKATPKEIENIKKQVTKIFKANDLKITIDANKKIVNFLDVTFNLTNGTYKPYMKPNNKLLYVHRQSNHPPTLLKNIPLNINKRLTNISSNQEVFNETVNPYQKALDESGYSHKLTFNPQPNERRQRNKNRKRNITWYNPPWDSNVKTNLGKKFLNAVDKCFPKDHPLHKIFNRHTLSEHINIKTCKKEHNADLPSAGRCPLEGKIRLLHGKVHQLQTRVPAFGLGTSNNKTLNERILGHYDNDSYVTKETMCRMLLSTEADMIYVLHACALYHRKPIKRTRRYNDIKIFSALRGKGWDACDVPRRFGDLYPCSPMHSLPRQATVIAIMPDYTLIERLVLK